MGKESYGCVSEQNISLSVFLESFFVDEIKSEFFRYHRFIIQSFHAFNKYNHRVSILDAQGPLRCKKYC